MLRVLQEHGAFAWAVSAALLVLKAPDAFLHPQFWAEDGLVFFAQQHRHGGPLLFSPYAGYLTLIPRLVAWIATAFPVVDAPTIYSGAAFGLGAAGLAALRILGRLGLPFWLVLATVALTPTNDEVFGTLTNAQWLTQFVLLGAVLRCLLGDGPRPGWRRAIPRTAILAAVSLTGPFSIIATLAAAAGGAWSWLSRLVTNPSERNAVPVAKRGARREIAVIGTCAVVQCLVVARTADLLGPSPGWRAVVQVCEALPSHVLGSVPFPAGAFCALVAALAAVSVRTAPHGGGRRAALVSLVAYVLLGAFATALKLADRPGAFIPLSIGDRYFLMPKLFAWWMLALALSGLLPRAPMAAPAAVLALLVAVASVQPQVLRRRELPPLGWRRRARAIERGEHVVVPIHPKPWMFELPAAAGRE